jgi:hypothetical protein
MKIRKFYSVIFAAAFLIYPMTSNLCGVGSDQEPKAASVLAPNLLGQEYVDVLNGFSLRPLAGCELADHPVRPDSPDAYPVAFSSGPPYWEHLKVPPSKELVRFFDGKKDIGITVSLLVTRQKMTIQNMLELRQAFWESGGKAVLASGKTEIIHDRPVAIVEFSWSASGPDKPGLAAREALIQHEQNRYYSILLTWPVSAQNDQNLMLDWQSLLSNFTCFNEADFQQRSTAARKNAQQLLTQLPAVATADQTAGQAWYRIVHAGREIGFRRLTHQPIKYQDAPAQQFIIDDVLREGLFLPDYARMMGVWLFAGREDNSEQPPTEPVAGPVRLLERSTLKNDLSGGEFEVGIQEQQKPGNRKRCLGSWASKALKISMFADPQNPDQSVNETFEINDKIFLTWPHMLLMGKSVSRQVGQEYIFVSYLNGSLGYFSMRMAAKTVWQPSEPVPSSSAAADKAAATTASPAAPSDKSAANAIPAWLLVSRMDTDGTIVDIWLDNNGQVLQQKHNELMLILSDAPTVQKLWSEVFKELNPDSPK